MPDVSGVEKRLKPRGETPEKTAEGVEVVEGAREAEGKQGVSEVAEVAGVAEVSEVAEIPVAEQTPVSAPTPITGQKDRLTQEIENVLQEDLTEAFLKMPKEKQKEFKKVGEETTGKIRVLMSKAKINARKILDLIKRWLKLIPGVNKFFLEQEAKIKTDKIIRLS